MRWKKDVVFKLLSPPSRLLSTRELARSQRGGLWKEESQTCRGKAVNNDVVVLYMWKGGFCKSLPLVFLSTLHVFCSLQTRVSLSPTCPLVIGRCRFCLSWPRLPPLELSLSPLNLWPAPSLGLSPAPSPSFANHTKPKPADPIWCHVFLQWSNTCPRVSQYGPVCSGRGWGHYWHMSGS